MHDAQGGLCGLCGQACATGKFLAVDHDHHTNQVRKLLCSNCNRALGHAQENPALLRKMADYIEEFKRKAKREEIATTGEGQDTSDIPIADTE